ncbi:hypothetical protein BJV77DRAFT_94999 [Russula vinacea]|nr:hypothetical protein BJV77DRAFT_94999 [Russula vinacea]
MKKKRTKMQEGRAEMVAQRKNKNGTKKDIIQQTRLWRAQPPHLVWPSPDQPALANQSFGSTTYTSTSTISQTGPCGCHVRTFARARARLELNNCLRHRYSSCDCLFPWDLLILAAPRLPYTSSALLNTPRAWHLFSRRGGLIAWLRQSNSTGVNIKKDQNRNQNRNFVIFLFPMLCTPHQRGHCPSAVPSPSLPSLPSYISDKGGVLSSHCPVYGPFPAGMLGSIFQNCQSSRRLGRALAEFDLFDSLSHIPEMDTNWS